MGEHWHSRQEEVLSCFEAEGLFIVDDVEHRVVPGTTVFAGRWVRHRIVNTGKVDFKMTWTFLPPGLHEFAAAIGRPRPSRGPPTRSRWKRRRLRAEDRRVNSGSLA
jgi:hypothetical protein